MEPSRGPLATRSELSARILERATHAWGSALTLDQAARLEAYLHLLARWNRAINLTALSLDGFPDATLDRLLGEPLAAASHVPDDGGSWFDLGSGGGTPAIPLKIARSSLALTMVESRSRKAAFLGEAVRVLKLERTVVLAERFEKLDSSTNASADLVTVRAVRVDAVFLRAALGLLKAGGRLMLFKSSGGTAADARSHDKWPAALHLLSSTTLPGPDSLLEIWERL